MLERMRTGERYRFTLDRSGARFTSTFEDDQHGGLDLFGWAYIFGNALAVPIAAIIAVRRSSSRYARALVVLLCAPTFAICLTPYNFVTPFGKLDVVVGVFGNMLNYVGHCAIPLVYWNLFRTPLSRVRIVFTWMCAASVAAAIAFKAVSAWALWTGTPALYFSPSAWPVALTEAVAYGTLLICFALAVSGARGSERALILWSSMMVVFSSAAALLWSFVSAAAIDSALLSDANRIVQDVTVLLAPFFVAYAILNRRLLDVGFALNRAIVFSVVSAMMVATFVLVEWGLTEWLTTASHAENVVIAGALALALGLSLRFVHKYVDAFVDRVFFAKRHRDLDAINEFTREAPYITSRESLLDRMRATLVEHSDASSVLVFEYSDGRYGVIDENDRAIVAMRAKHDAVDLHDYETALSGEYAVPMASRGRLLAVLVVGAKESGDSYAPDELHAIRHMAHGVASALDVMSKHLSLDPLYEQLESIQRSLAALPAALRDAVTEARIAGT